MWEFITKQKSVLVEMACGQWSLLHIEVNEIVFACLFFKLENPHVTSFKLLDGVEHNFPRSDLECISLANLSGDMIKENSRRGMVSAFGV